MRTRLIRHSLPKDGHRRVENEDAFSYRPSIGRFAIADGATESSYSGAWARMLVEAMATPGRLLPDIPLLQDRWAGGFLNDPTLPWYSRAKAEQGAFATLLILQIRSEGTWQCAAIGDSCLFVSRPGEIEAFPLSDVSEFGTSPDLIGSRPASIAGLEGRLRHRSGQWVTGDSFLLATDAVAAYVVESCVAGGRSVSEALRLDSPPGVRRRHLSRLRAARRIKNDDLTYCAILTV